MNRDEVREYLARWLLEFGTETMPIDRMLCNQWYTRSARWNPSALRPYMTATEVGSHVAYHISERGFELLKGDTDDDGEGVDIK